MNFQIIIEPPDTQANWTAFNRDCEELNSDFLMQPINEADYDSETQACVDARTEGGPKSFYDHYVTKRRKKKGMKGLGVEHPAKAIGGPDHLRVTPTDSVGFGGSRREGGLEASESSASASASPSDDSSHEVEETSPASSSPPPPPAVVVVADNRSLNGMLDVPSAAKKGGGGVASAPAGSKIAAQRALRRQQRMLNGGHSTSAYSSAVEGGGGEDVSAASEGEAKDKPLPKHVDPSFSADNFEDKRSSGFLSVPATNRRSAPTTAAAGGGSGKSIAAMAKSAAPPAFSIVIDADPVPNAAIPNVTSPNATAPNKAPPTTAKGVAASASGNANAQFHASDLLDVPNRITASKGALNNAAIRRIACGRNPTPVYNAPTGFRSLGVNAGEPGGAANPSSSPATVKESSSSVVEAPATETGAVDTAEGSSAEVVAPTPAASEGEKKEEQEEEKEEEGHVTCTITFLERKTEMQEASDEVIAKEEESA